MRVAVLVIGLLVLAGCGVDGPPERPAATGLAVSGDVRAGVTGGT